MIRGSEAEGYTCPTCYFEQEKQLLKLGLGQIKADCADCHITQADVQRTGKRMAMHRKDGVWQFLCPNCSDRYYARAGIYDGTAIAHIKKLRGYK